MLDKQRLLTKNNKIAQISQFEFAKGQRKASNSISIIPKYNQFIKCYNKPCNRIDERTLTPMHESKQFNFVFSLIKKQKPLVVLVLFSFFLPFVNAFLLIYLIAVLSVYFKNLKVYLKNQRKIDNPMKNMKYDPEMCSKLQQNFHFFTLNFKSLSSDFNFKQNEQLLQSQGKVGSKSQWMIYNDQFASYYKDFPKWKKKFIIIIVLSGTISLAINTLVFCFL